MRLRVELRERPDVKEDIEEELAQYDDPSRFEPVEDSAEPLVEAEEPYERDKIIDSPEARVDHDAVVVGGRRPYRQPKSLERAQRIILWARSPADGRRAAEYVGRYVLRKRREEEGSAPWISGGRDSALAQ